MHVAFGRVRRKTEPTGPGAETVIFLKLTPTVRLETREKTPQQKPYRSWVSKIGRKNRELNNPAPFVGAELRFPTPFSVSVGMWHARYAELLQYSLADDD